MMTKLDDDFNEKTRYLINKTYREKHKFMRKLKKKSERCEICNGIKLQLDLASIDHTYSDNPDDWLYLCRKCHRNMDELNKPLEKSAYSKANYRKTVVISNKQNESWNRNTNERIRDFLDGKYIPKTFLKFLYDFMNTNMTPKIELTDKEKDILEEIERLV